MRMFLPPSFSYSKLLFIAFVLMIQTVSSFSQDIVISEYKNIVAVPIGEYTELLVLKDNFDLVGFTLRDNSASGTWQGGVTFKNVALWKNLRAGTVILIFHRGTSIALDAIPNDGSITVGAEDASLFDKVVFSTTDWAANALNIAQSGDMMQLTDASGNNHHTLGHGSVAYRTAYFDGIIGAKLYHEIPGGITANVFVYPGLSPADYIMPNPGNAKTLHSAIETPTLPNYSILPQASENSQFWRQIRAPQWNAPTVTGTVSQAGVNLSWNQLVDPYPADQYQGYLIMRGAKSPSALPQDGKNYVRGDMIGNWEVVANITGTANVTYLDINPLPCGDTVNYRIYGFRYGAPNNQIDSIACSQFPYLAKGRSYNETSFGAFSAFRPVPAIPIITALGTTTICEGTDVTLKVENSYPNGTGYQWFKDGAPINGANGNVYKANVEGSYRVRVNGVNGCANESVQMAVTILPKPNGFITPSKEVRICAGDTVQLQAGPTTSSTFTWLYNGATTQSTGAKFFASKAGNYQVIVKDDKGCIDTSDITTVVFRTVTISFPDSKIDFGNLDGCKSSMSGSSLLRNSGKDTAIITDKDIIIPSGFQYVSPALPIILAPGKTATLTFSFNPTQPGETKGEATIRTSTCNAFANIQLRGFKEQASVTQSVSVINHGMRLSCDVKPKDTIIVIENKGNADLIISNAVVKSPFQVISPSTFPITIKPGSNASISIRYTPSTVETIYSDKLMLPYRAGSCVDTLFCTLLGEVRLPKFDIPTNELNIIPLSGCTITRDSIFHVVNTGSTNITLDAKPTSGLTVLSPMPIVIKPGDTAFIKIRVEPPTDGQYKGFVTLTSKECSVQRDYVIRTTKESANYSLSKTSHQFIPLIRCDAQNVLKDSIMIKASALGISGDATISDVQISGPFASSISKGDILAGGNKDFMIMFIPNQDGVFNGKLSITFEPCAITKTIDLSGSLTTTSFEINQTAIDFPVTDSGIVEQKTFTLKNTGKERIRIASIAGLVSPFSYVSSKQPLEDITPGEIVTFTISYAPIASSVDSMTVSLLIDAGNCSKQFTITVKGIGNKPKPKDVNGSFDLIGESRSAAPGQTVIIPFKIASTTMQDMNIAGLSFEVTYNRSLLIPKSLKMNQQNITATMRENTPGVIRIETAANDTLTRLLTGDLLELECMALLGDAMSTPLAIGNQSFVKRTSGTCAVTVNTPIFSLTDICDLPNRLIKVQGQLAIAKKQNALSVDVFSQDKTILELYSMDGSLIECLINASLTSGNHEISLPKDLQSGFYMAILRSGTLVRTLPFGHIR
ncbi:MAG: choice-of-anchor D domain-containing protein [bacterium]